MKNKLKQTGHNKIAIDSWDYKPGSKYKEEKR